MLVNVALAIGLLVVVLVAIVAMRQAEFRIVRSRTVAAPPDVVHACVNDFRNWPAWSPWEKLDPTMTREVSGSPSGPGATYHWMGNKKVGEGRMTITESRPPRSVTIRLEFLKPWTATNTTVFELTPSGGGTHVTWAMTGRHNFMAKAFSLFVNMDKLVGGDFEKGLAGLDAATAAPKPPPR